jgi:predicted CXXCH cytochrome family protein
VPPGPLSIIARGTAGSELRLDGKVLAAAQPSAGVLSATATPSAGPHTLSLVTGDGEQRIEFLVRGGSGAPPGWKPFRPHPPPASCESCHAVRDGAWGFQRATLAPSCFACHDQKAFAPSHSHNEVVLAECQLCHHAHGSTEKFHLKIPRDTACKLCHG